MTKNFSESESFSNDSKYSLLSSDSSYSSSSKPVWTLILFVLVLILLIFQFIGCGSGLPQGTSFNEISQMEIGEAKVLNFSNGKAELYFLEDTIDQTYIIGLSGGLSGFSMNVQSLGESNPDEEDTPPGANPGAPLAFQENPGQEMNPTDIHQWFREEEKRFAGSIEKDLSPISNQSSSPLALGGSTKNIKILTNSNLDYTIVTCDRLGQGEKVDVYVDRNTDVEISQELIDEFTENLDAIIDGPLFKQFSNGTDIDGNGKVNVVLSPELAYFGPGSPLSGYFWAGDLTNHPASNFGEYIYLISPSHKSFYGGLVPVEEVLLRIHLGIFSHEYQHYLNFLHKGGQENNTVNESLSHAMEYLYPHELRYKQDECIKKLDTIKLGMGTTGIGERGCGGLFVQHVCEQEGDYDQCLKNLVSSPYPGWNNLSITLQKDLGQLLGKFLAALILTGFDFEFDSPFQFEELGIGPAGDITGFSPNQLYNDYRHTFVESPVMEEVAPPFSRTVSGFAHYIVVQSTEDLQLNLSGADINNGFWFGGGASILRLE